MKTLLLTLALMLCPWFVSAQELPDTPQPQQTITNRGFFAFRGSWQDPPLRTNRQMFKSKTFILSAVGGDVAMVVACRNPRSKERWDSEVPAVFAVDGLAYLGGRFFTQSYAVAPGIYKIIHYSIAAAR